MVSADLAAFIRVALGYVGLGEAQARGLVGFSGSKPAIATLCRLLQLLDEPVQKRWRFASDASTALAVPHGRMTMQHAATAA